MRIFSMAEKVKKSFCQKVILSFFRVDYHEGWGNANPNANPNANAKTTAHPFGLWAKVRIFVIF